MHLQYTVVSYYILESQDTFYCTEYLRVHVLPLSHWVMLANIPYLVSSLLASPISPSRCRALMSSCQWFNGFLLLLIHFMIIVFIQLASMSSTGIILLSASIVAKTSADNPSWIPSERHFVLFVRISLRIVVVSIGNSLSVSNIIIMYDAQLQ